MAESNPNGANQYTLDPRQKLCWDSYINPKSETFGNALQSALKAGYEESTANLITTTEWFREKYRKLNLVEKAEKNLETALNGGLDDPEKGKKEIQWKATEMTLKTLRKSEYSERTELTGADGSAIQISGVDISIIKNES